MLISFRIPIFYQTTIFCIAESDTVGYLRGCGAFQLPSVMKGMQAMINIESDGEGIKYTVLSVLHYNDRKMHRPRVSKYSAWEEELNFDGLNSEEMDMRLFLVVIC